MSRAKKLLFGAAIGVTLFFGYSALFKTETPAEHFRKAMAVREKYCATHKIQAGDTSCNILKLQLPDPIATPEGRFAHSIKVPGAPLQDVYRRGMTSADYFKALCDTQAGEFIFRAVKGVDGILQMRPRSVATDEMLMHLYAIEDPFGAVTEGDAEAIKHHLVTPSRYKYMERLFRDTAGKETILRTMGFGTSTQTNGYERFDDRRVPTHKAKYGFTWRGLEVPNGREHAIAGSELIVVDIETSEVVAFRRGFIRSGGVKNAFTGIWWMGGDICPRGQDIPEYYTFDFLDRVLIGEKRAGEAQNGK